MKTVEDTLIIIKPEAIERKLIGEIITKIEKADLQIVGMMLTVPDEEIAKMHYPEDIKWYLHVGNHVLNAFLEGEYDEDVLGTLDTIELGKRVRVYSVDSLKGKQVMVCIVRGVDAVKRVKERIVGESSNVFKCSPGTIRGDYCSDNIIKSNLEGRAIRNLVHRSSNAEDAAREIEVWFGDKERVQTK